MKILNTINTISDKKYRENIKENKKIFLKIFA